MTMEHQSTSRVLANLLGNLSSVESNEIGVVTVGDPQVPNILLYEAAEGSLGIRSQFVDDVEVFQKVVELACTFCYRNKPCLCR
jgi:hypothetical protein